MVVAALLVMVMVEVDGGSDGGCGGDGGGVAVVHVVVIVVHVVGLQVFFTVLVFCRWLMKIWRRLFPLPKSSRVMSTVEI